MADVTAEEIINVRASQYAGDLRIPLLLILAEEFLGDKIPVVTPRNFAKALQVLHWLTLDDRNKAGNTGAGTIIGEREGELEIKYGSTGQNVMAFTSDWKGELGQTTWGVELYAFCKKYMVPVVTRFS